MSVKVSQNVLVENNIVTEGKIEIEFGLSGGDLKGEHKVGPFVVDLKGTPVRNLIGDAAANAVIRIQGPLRKDSKTGATAADKIKQFNTKAARGLTWSEISSGMRYEVIPTTAEGFAALFERLSPEEQAKFLESRKA